MKRKPAFDRTDAEAYATRLETVVYALHERFWYAIDETGRLVPEAADGNERQLIQDVLNGLDAIQAHTGRRVDFRTKARFDRRILFAASVLLSAAFLADVLWNDVVLPIKDVLLAILN